MSTATATLPAPGSWRIATSDSLVGISGRANRFAPAVSASFSGVRGEMQMSADPDRSHVLVEIELATMTTGNALYDEVLRTADPFHLDEHPRSRFESTQVRWSGAQAQVHGVLELAGRTSALVLSARYEPLPSGQARLVGSGEVSTSILGRFDLPGLGWLVPRTMTMEISVTATWQGAEPPAGAVPAPRPALTAC